MSRQGHDGRRTIYYGRSEKADELAKDGGRS